MSSFPFFADWAAIAFARWPALGCSKYAPPGYQPAEWDYESQPLKSDKPVDSGSLPQQAARSLGAAKSMNALTFSGSSPWRG